MRVELTLEIAQELCLSGRIRARFRRRRHHAGADLADDFLPCLRVLGDVPHVDLVEEQTRVQRGRRLVRAVVTLDAVLGNESLWRREPLARDGAGRRLRDAGPCNEQCNTDGRTDSVHDVPPTRLLGAYRHKRLRFAVPTEGLIPL